MSNVMLMLTSIPANMSSWRLSGWWPGEKGLAVGVEGRVCLNVLLLLVVVVVLVVVWDVFVMCRSCGVVVWNEVFVSGLDVGADCIAWLVGVEEGMVCWLSIFCMLKDMSKPCIGMWTPSP